MEGMWFYDEAEEEWGNFRKEAQDVEKEHLAIRVALRDAEAMLRADPGREQLQARIEELKTRLEELEGQFPWISSEVPVEVLLWGVPHG
jgi:chromosome segregation ATPase